MKRGAHITQVNGVETSAINIADRGLAYGDGVFETIRFCSGQAPLYDLHKLRFIEGVKRLQLGDASELSQIFDQEFAQVTKQMKRSVGSKDAVIKLMVTRGSFGRGYVPPAEAECQFIAQVFELPSYPESYARDGIETMICEHRLADQPYLAGIKHLNRLDQVISSRELGELPEGLTLSQNGDVIEGTKSNILLFEAGKIITPKIDKCGVKGVLREYLIQHPASLISEEQITLDRLKNAEGLAMVNSVFGVWPVRKVDSWEFSLTKQYELIHDLLAEELGYK